MTKGGGGVRQKVIFMTKVGGVQTPLDFHDVIYVYPLITSGKDWESTSTLMPELQTDGPIRRELQQKHTSSFATTKF